jgi:pimeloyl-ACP methyl ester carboxylesterase
MLEWQLPEEGEDMKSYAARYKICIDTTEAYAFVGLSLGGMVALELAEMMSPKMCVLISSAIRKQDLPKRYALLENVPIYKLVNGNILAATSMVLPYVIPIDKSGAKLYGHMVRQYDPVMFQRQVAMLVNWERKSTSVDYVHIHGKKDRIIPFRKQSRVTYPINGGGHKMLMTHSEEINIILNENLGFFSD